MNVLGSAWYNPISWLWRNSTPIDQTESFSNALNSDIADFENQIKTTFASPDKSLEDKFIVIYYTFKTVLKDLEVNYYFTNQRYDWPRNESQFSKIFLAKPISKEIHYAALDENAHIRIDEFIQKTSALFPGTFSGIRFQDSSGSSNLTKVVFFAQTYFEYHAGMTTVEISSKIRSFKVLTTLLEDQLTRVINNKPLSMIIPIEEPYRAGSKPKSNPKFQRSSTLPVQEVEELPFANDINTNLKATDLLAKQSVFNTLFNTTSSAVNEYSFDMRDSVLQFDVAYQKNTTQFVGYFPAIFSTKFDVIKELQESQRIYCIVNSQNIQPQGSLKLMQDNFNFNFQYMVSAPISVSEPVDKLQDDLNTFQGNVKKVQVL